MTDLLTLAREHDLPPKWEGLAVLWRGWEAGLRNHVIICPPPKTPECCAACGSFEEPVTNRGLVAVALFLTHDQLRAEEENRKRLGSLAHKRKPRALYRLFAHRCPDCKHDVVWDTDTDDWWDLDHTDYGPDGST